MALAAILATRPAPPHALPVRFHEPASHPDTVAGEASATIAVSATVEVSALDGLAAAATVQTVVTCELLAVEVRARAGRVDRVVTAAGPDVTVTSLPADVVVGARWDLGVVTVDGMSVTVDGLTDEPEVWLALGSPWLGEEQP